MKYLIKHRKESIISLGVFVTVLLVIFWSIWSIIQGTFDYKNLITVAAAIFEILGWYYNMPTSEENCEATGEMRAKKAEKNGTVEGEYFYSDDDELDLVEGEVEDDSIQ
jgi:hypothetical protein